MAVTLTRTASLSSGSAVRVLVYPRTRCPSFPGRPPDPLFPLYYHHKGVTHGRMVANELGELLVTAIQVAVKIWKNLLSDSPRLAGIYSFSHFLGI